MQNIARKIYYDKQTGTPILDTGEHTGGVRITTVEEDFISYSALSERNPESVGVIQLEFGQFSQDFAECNGYRVNLGTLELEFSYPDPNEPEEPPVYQKPLTEQILELKEDLIVTSRLLADNSTAQQDLLEFLMEMGII